MLLNVQVSPVQLELNAAVGGWLAALTVTVVGLVGGSVAVAVLGVTAIGAAIGVWAIRYDT